MTNAGMSTVRKNNTRNRILGIIRDNGKIAKTEIKNETRYSMATVLSTIDELENENLIYYAEKGTSLSGRKPVYISLNPNGGYFVGLSFNAAEVSAVLLDYSGEVRDFMLQRFAFNELSVLYVMTHVRGMLRQMLDAHRDLKSKIVGVGVGAPGYVDERTGISIFYPHIPQWKNINILRMLREEEPDLNIYIDNNTNGMELAYKWLRPEFKNLSYALISIRSGVRMSYISNRVLQRGKNHTAGEIGHIRVNGGNRYCPCGKCGCLDTEISETAVREKLLSGIRVKRFNNLWLAAGCNPDNVTMSLFVECVRSGDSECLALFDEICEFLGEAIAQVLNILNPDSVIISSEYCQLGRIFFERLEKVLEQRAIFVALEGFSLKSSDYGEKIAAIGAAAIVMENELDYVNAMI